MTQVTRTIKLKFLDLNKVKRQMFADMLVENTSLANKLLAMPYMERREITTARVQTTLKSALANQTIRHTISATGRKVKQYKKLPVEINKQNWKLEKRGETYSISFPTIQGVKRIPISIASSHWEPVLQQILSGEAVQGSAKLIFHRYQWYVYMSVTVDVPQAQTQNRIGCDRGQNNLAVVAPASRFGKFFSGQEIKHRRRRFQNRRESLQKAKKFRALKRWDKKERRWMEAVNHTVSRRIVRFAEFHQADVVIEDLKGCRKTMKQKKVNRQDAGESRQSWAYLSLEMKLNYKLALVGLELIQRPAPYTSKSCSTCGTIGNRQRHHFKCSHGHYHNSDLNAAHNLAQWDGFSCSLDLQRVASAMGAIDLENGWFGNTLNSMNALPVRVGN